MPGPNRAGDLLGLRRQSSQLRTSGRSNSARVLRVALELAVEFGLPVAAARRLGRAAVGFPFRTLAAERECISPDYLVRVEPGPEHAGAPGSAARRPHARA